MTVASFDPQLYASSSFFIGIYINCVVSVCKLKNTVWCFYCQPSGQKNCTSVNSPEESRKHKKIHYAGFDLLGQREKKESKKTPGLF